MKVLHCIYDHIRNPWVAGGGAFRVHEIYRRFPETHDITIVSGAYPGAVPYAEGNTRYMFLGARWNNYVLSTFSYAAKTANYLREHAGDYDIVVEDFAPYNPVFSFLRHKAAVIQLHQREGILHLKKYFLLGVPFFLVEKFYPLFFSSSVTISRISGRKFGLRGRTVVIPNGFDRELLNEGPEEEDYMLFLGRLHIDQKGLDVLHDALLLAGAGLVVAGAGKDEVRVRSLFENAVNSGKAEFAGFVSGQRKTDLLRKCLFMVVPSRYEGLPLTVIEAAACGKPVIVSDIPELKYAVDAGFGLPFRTGDAKDLADKMNVLLRDQSLRGEMGKRGKAFAYDYTWDRIAADYENFLLETVKGAR
ncbi:MAG: glycosyltransferase family 4 protein [Nitrospirae bacterium]|nr:glycosyltransferase family 4 protein [Nitrospirota bacterium]